MIADFSSCCEHSIEFYFRIHKNTHTHTHTDEVTVSAAEKRRLIDRHIYIITVEFLFHSRRNIFGSVNCLHVCDEGLLLLKGHFLIKECHSNGDFGQIPEMASQRLYPYLPDDRVVLLQGLANGDIMTESTDGGTRQEPDTNVVFGNKNAEVTQFFRERSIVTHGRSRVFAVDAERNGERRSTY